MAISYKAGNAEQRSFTVLPAGEYAFRVLDAEEKRSSNGNDMIALKLDVYDDKGKQAVVYDNLVFNEKAQWKVDHFLKSCGMLPEEGSEVNLSANEFIGYEGKVKLRVGKNNKDQDRNEVDAYLWDEPF